MLDFQFSEDHGNLLWARDRKYDYSIEYINGYWELIIYGREDKIEIRQFDNLTNALVNAQNHTKPQERIFYEGPSS